MLGHAPIDLPSSDLPPGVARAGKEYARLLSEHQETAQRLSELNQEREAAAAADRDAYAAALRQRKGDPGQPATDKLEAEATTAQRKYDALGQAVTDAQADLIKAVDDHRSTWAAGLAGEIDEARKTYDDAIGAVERARGQMIARVATRAWLAGFPSRTRWRGTSNVPLIGVLAPNGNPVSFEDITAAMRVEVDPPKRGAEPPSPQLQEAG